MAGGLDGDDDLTSGSCSFPSIAHIGCVWECTVDVVLISIFYIHTAFRYGCFLSLSYTDEASNQFFFAL